MEKSVVEPDLESVRAKLRCLGFEILPPEDETSRLLAFRRRGLNAGVVFSRVTRLDSSAIDAARTRDKPVLDNLAEDVPEFAGHQYRVAAHVFLCDEVDPALKTRLTRPWPSLGSWRWMPAAFDLRTGEVFVMERIPLFGGQDLYSLVDLVRRIRDPYGTSDLWPLPSPVFRRTCAAVAVAFLLLALLSHC